MIILFILLFTTAVQAMPITTVDMFRTEPADNIKGTYIIAVVDSTPNCIPDDVDYEEFGTNIGNYLRDERGDGNAAEAIKRAINKNYPCGR